MDSTIKEKWLAALRSGKYKQGTDKLRTKESKFCCLGVLCDVYRKETKLGKWGKDILGNFDFKNTKKGNREYRSSGVLPLSVMEWAELTQDNPVINNTQSLAGLNDRGDSFEKIADIIEKNL